MRWGLCLLALGCSQPTEATPGFTLELSGAVTLRTAGRVEYGSAGAASEPYYTITLGGREGQAAVVFTRRTPATVTAGRYLVGEGQLANDGFGAIIITGPPSHPTGVFQVQHGVLRLNGSGPAHLTGEFELHAAGFLSESPEQDDWQVTAKGRFTTRVDQRVGALGSTGAGSQ